MASLEENKAIALRLGEVWHQGTVEELDTIVAPDFVDHAPSGEVTAGLEAFKARYRLLKGAFPDLVFAYKQIIAEGEYVVMHWLVSGTHLGEYLDYPATGLRVYWHGNTILRVMQGKIAECWTYHDSDSLVKQLRGDATAAS